MNIDQPPQRRQNHALNKLVDDIDSIQLIWK